MNIRQWKTLHRMPPRVGKLNRRSWRIPLWPWIVAALIWIMWAGAEGAFQIAQEWVDRSEQEAEMIASHQLLRDNLDALRSGPREFCWHDKRGREHCTTIKMSGQ